MSGEKGWKTENGRTFIANERHKKETEHAEYEPIERKTEFPLHRGKKWNSFPRERRSNINAVRTNPSRERQNKFDQKASVFFFFLNFCRRVSYAIQIYHRLW